MGRKKVSSICQFCKLNFFVLPSELKRGKGKFCSRKCYYNSIKGRLVVQIGTKPWNKGKTNIYSEETLKKMGIIHKGKPSCMFGRKHSFESKKKMSLAKLSISENEWKGFVESVNKRERIRFRNEVQRQVFKRDDYTCQICGQHGGHLQVDHIQPWAEYIELRFDIENCRTLCMACHYKVTFGRELPEGVVWGHNLNQAFCTQNGGC
jgi:hypothetical protein